MAIVTVKETDDVRIETACMNYDAVTIKAERVLELYEESKKPYQGRFSDAHENLMERFDRCVADLREHLMEPDHLNVESGEMKKTLAELDSCIRDVFRLKCVWHDADRAAGV